MINIVDDLFPKLQTIQQEPVRMEYVSQRLIELAQNGEIDLVALLNQPQGTRNMIAHVLQGHYMSGGVQHHDGACPPELSDVKIRLRSTQGDPIRWKVGHRVVGSKVVARGNARVPVAEETWRYPCGADAMEGDVSLPDAWVIMQRNGKDCATARSSRMRECLWRYEVVTKKTAAPPPTSDGGEQVKRKRGRPPGSKNKTNADAEARA